MTYSLNSVICSESGVPDIVRLWAKVKCPFCHKTFRADITSTFECPDCKRQYAVAVEEVIKVN